MKINIVPYQAHYAKAICHVFDAAVHAIDPAIYSKAQQDAWCATPLHDPKWVHGLQHKKTWLEMQNEIVLGFIAFEDNGYIDCLYVHPDFQGQRIASQLYQHVLTFAAQLALKSLSVNSSQVALPIFQKWGFVTVNTNAVRRGGEVLINFHLKKVLPA